MAAGRPIRTHWVRNEFSFSMAWCGRVCSTLIARTDDMNLVTCRRCLTEAIRRNTPTKEISGEQLAACNAIQDRLRLVDMLREIE